jgi:hypothetical protein
MQQLFILHSLAWVKNALWDRPCLSVCLSAVTFFSLRARQLPGLTQGVKWTQGFALWESLPPPPQDWPSRALSTQAFTPFTLPQFVALPIALWPPPPPGLAVIGIETLGFYHLRLDHTGLRKIGTTPKGLGHPWGEATSGDYTPR